MKGLVLDLFTERNLRFKALWLEGNLPFLPPGGTYIWRGDLTEGFLRCEFVGLYLEGLIHRGAYFRNFTVYYKEHDPDLKIKYHCNISQNFVSKCTRLHLSAYSCQNISGGACLRIPL